MLLLAPQVVLSQVCRDGRGCWAALLALGMGVRGDTDGRHCYTLTPKRVAAVMECGITLARACGNPEGNVAPSL